MLPMIAGVGPLLGGEHVGAFVARDGSRLPWTYRDGRAHVDTTITTVETEPYHVSETPPLAVLTSSRTIGAAEDVAIAFRGRPETRSFGLPTAGEAAMPAAFHLPDGSWLRLSVAYPSDRDGAVYSGPIEPDHRVEIDMWDDHAVAESTAAAWLLDHEACR